MVLPKPGITKYPPISHKLKAQILKKIPAKYYKPWLSRINPRDTRCQSWGNGLVGRFFGCCQKWNLRVSVSAEVGAREDQPGVASLPGQAGLGTPSSSGPRLGPAKRHRINSAQGKGVWLNGCRTQASKAACPVEFQRTCFMSPAMSWCGRNDEMPTTAKLVRELAPWEFYWVLFSSIHLLGIMIHPYRKPSQFVRQPVHRKAFLNTSSMLALFPFLHKVHNQSHLPEWTNSVLGSWFRQESANRIHRLTV